MRRIYKTTTAIVTCISLIVPQLAAAQAQQDGDAAQPEKLQIRPKAKEKHEAQQEQQEPQAAPEKAAEAERPPEPQAAPAEPAAERPAEPALAQQEPKAAPKAPDSASEPEQAAKEPTPKAEHNAAEKPPVEKPAMTQAEEPAPKPELVEAETPRAKPADAPEAAARVEELEKEAKKTPAPKPEAAKPETPKAVVTGEPAPAQKPQTPSADALKQALEQKAAEDTPAKPVAPKGKPTEAQATADQAPPKQAKPAQTEQPVQDQQAQEQTPPAKPGKPQPGQDLAVDGQPAPTPDATELEKQLQQAGGKPVAVQAPEAETKPNAVAQRAAEQVAPVAAAALAAGAEAQQVQSSDIQITKDQVRSSAQDFTTSVAQGLQPGQEQEAKRDKDDTLKDIGKLLLAGAAGMAVGKMLSNDREVALNTGDRVVVTLPDGSQQVLKDDNALLYQPGSNVRTENFQDGSSRTTVLRADGSRVVTIRDANMNILRRTLVSADGTETRLIDDTEAKPVKISTLPAPPPVEISRRPLSEAALREALRREASVDRRFSLGQIRDIPEVRALIAPVNVPEITFDTGSSAITPDQAQQLSTLGKVIRDSIDRNPREIYMIEGYTDAVGSNAANLALSDRRAESVALALTEYFQVPPENMVVQGYGEQFLLVPTDGPERDNRRVAVRRITDLLEQK